MGRRRAVRVLMSGGKWQLSPGEAIPALPDPPPDPVTLEEKLALNGTLPPARIKELMREPDGTSAGNQTRRKYIGVGKCATCGADGQLATKTMCVTCAEKHRKATAAVKQRMLAHGLCVNCSRKNSNGHRMCNDCRAKHNKRYH